jgi:hypothetical protein
MPEYALFFTYTSDASDAMVEKAQGSRRAGARHRRRGGRHDGLVLLDVGPHDGLSIFDAHTPTSAGAVSGAVGSTGSFEHLETHELTDPGPADRTVGKRSRMRAALSAAASADHGLIVVGSTLRTMVGSPPEPVA